MAKGARLTSNGRTTWINIDLDVDEVARDGPSTQEISAITNIGQSRGSAPHTWASPADPVDPSPFDALAVMWNFFIELEPP